MGSVGRLESLEEIMASPMEVYEVLTDINLAQMWGQSKIGNLTYPMDSRMKLGMIVSAAPKGMKEPLKLKIKVMHFNEFIEMEVVDGHLFGMFKFGLEPRPYGTLITASLDYRIENMGFNLKWKLNEKKRFKSMLDEILINVKNLSQQRKNQS